MTEEEFDKAINVIKKEIALKDKVIDLMAMDLQYINNELLDYYDKLPYADNKNTKEIKEYFYKKVEKEI